jgi:hypothetical protein
LARPDLTLSAIFAERAAEFARGARLQSERGGPVAQGQILQSLCVGLELAFKAYLLARGRSDDWNRREIRHGLAKAAEAATGLGLPAPAPAVTRLIEAAGPAYARHALDELPALEIGISEAVRLVDGQLATIFAALADPLGQDPPDRAVSQTWSARRPRHRFLTVSTTRSTKTPTLSAAILIAST